MASLNKITRCRPRVLPKYVPITTYWQRKQCKNLNLPFIKKLRMRKPSRPILVRASVPKLLRTTHGDGNCLFRCFSLVVTGTESYHDLLRKAITDHLQNNGEKFSAIMADGPDQYLSQSKMTHTKTWGSDVEILAAAHLLNTKIFVYTKHGPTWQWVEHDLELTSPNTRTHRHAIYLKHTQLVHYDVVVSVKKIPLTGPQKYKTSALRRAKLRRRCTRARGRGRFYYKRKCKTATSRRFMKRRRKRSYRLKS